MPDNVASVLYGKLSALYIREAVCACREVTVSIAPIVEVLVQVKHQASSYTVTRPDSHHLNIRLVWYSDGRIGSRSLEPPSPAYQGGVTGVLYPLTAVA